MSEIPKDLQHLVPKSQQILIGKDVVDIEPLTFGKWQTILESVKGAAMQIFSPDFIAALTNPDTKEEANSLMTSKIIDLIKDNLPKILSVALDKEEEYISNNITTEQMAFAVKKLWDMNLKQPVMDMRGLVDSISSIAPEAMIGMPPIAEQKPETPEAEHE